MSAQEAMRIGELSSSLCATLLFTTVLTLVCAVLRSAAKLEKKRKEMMVRPLTLHIRLETPADIVRSLSTGRLRGAEGGPDCDSQPYWLGPLRRQDGGRAGDAEEVDVRSRPAVRVQGDAREARGAGEEGGCWCGGGQVSTNLRAKKRLALWGD